MKKGITISLSDLDGSGKTTQTKLLKRHFHAKLNKVRIVRNTTYFLLKPWLKILRPLSGNKGKGPVKIYIKTLYKLWFIPTFIDFWLGYFAQIYPKLLKYDVLITDRYYSDQAVNLLYYGYPPRPMFDYIVKLFPRANIELFLSVFPNKAYNRSRKFTLSYYKDQSRLYKLLEKDRRATTMNSTISNEQILNRIIRKAELK